MKRYESFVEWTRVIFIVIIMILYDLLKKLLDESIPNDYCLYAFVLIILFITYKSLIFLSEYAISNSIHLRKLIFGKDFIEGTWVDVLIDNNLKKYLWPAILHIYYEKKKINIKGYIYIGNVKSGEWTSETSVYSDNKLVYSYSGFLSIGQPKIEKGLSEYHFAQEKPFPKYFFGILTDPIYKYKLSIEGEKISDEIRFESELNLDNGVEALLSKITDKYKQKGYSQIELSKVINNEYQ